MSTIFPCIHVWDPKFDKNPVGGLTELATARKWRLTYTPVKQIGPVHCRLFSMAVVINGWKFRDVKDRQKKTAKKQACLLALRVIYMRSKCILQDKIPENELDLARSMNLCQEDLQVIPDYLASFVPSSDADCATDGLTQSEWNDGMDEIMTDGSQPAKKPKMDYTISGGDKSPVNILSEYSQKNNLKFLFEVSGSSGEGHNTLHSVRLTVGTVSYPEVTAHSKKAARHNAAIMVIHMMLGEGHHLKTDGANMTPMEPPPPGPPPKRKVRLLKNLNEDVTGAGGEGVGPVFTRNAITILSEYAQSHNLTLRFDTLSEVGKPPNTVFEIAAVVGERVFTKVECSRKKVGKLKAAEKAINQILQDGEVIPSMNTGFVELEIGEHMTHYDKIAALSHKAVNKVLSTIPPLSGRKVVAALILKRDASDDGSVICLGVGNKVISGDCLSMSGEVVNDSHAEVIVRRSFIRYLYKELLRFSTNNVSQVLEFSQTGKFRIKEGITFHMYISTAPCGDAALFSPRVATSTEVETQDVATPIYTSASHGLLRSKIEAGEGTIPVDVNTPVLTWDGVLRGERLRTMSCSDKLCRWNVLGLQGALLSHYLDPIYMSSLTLGDLYHAGHVSRAISMRLNRDTNHPIQQDLPPTFYHTMPDIGKITVCKPPRVMNKTRTYSVNWVEGDEVTEITNATIGFIEEQGDGEQNRPSRICKAAFFKLFKELSERMKRHDLLSHDTYKAAKMAATNYQMAKAAVNNRFVANNLGHWLTKPVEGEMFG